MNDFEKLLSYFEQFPGIGARQARRFVFHLLRLSENQTNDLSILIKNLHGTVKSCDMCKRYFTHANGAITCDICSDNSRDTSRLLVVERDSDINTIERSGTYDGLYFVLGGTVHLLNAKEQTPLRGGALKHKVENANFEEIILAFSVNPDGENTIRYVRKLLEEVKNNGRFTLSVLGRGLSTGSELEYADPETIKYALNNRSKDLP